MSDFRELLHKRGYKATPQRDLILEILGQAQELMTAEKIVAIARERQPNLSTGTVYRNLNTLYETGLLNRVDLKEKGRSYEINRGHRHHLICLGCGETIAINFCPMKVKVGTIARENDFQVVGHQFEITGYCRQCQEKK
ncbi:MAG: Fur family transcriptional regulator [Chitinophagales bacterium]